MKRWYMLTVVGRDRAGIVAGLTAALYEGGCNLGEASMTRLGGNFTVMLMVEHAGDAQRLLDLTDPVAAEFELHCHVQRIAGILHGREDPDVRIDVYGADRAGIVAEATGRLAAAGLNFLALESVVGGTPAKPIYIMNIEGQATGGMEAIEAAVADLAAQDQGRVDVRLSLIETLVG